MALRILNRSPNLAALAALVALVAAVGLAPSPARAQSRVAGVVFEGNEAFNDRELRRVTRVQQGAFFNIFKPRFNFLVLGRDETHLKGWYRNRGYLQCAIESRVEPVAEGRVRAHFTIREGPLTLLEALRFAGNDLFSDEELHASIRSLRGVRLRPGDPINESAIQSGTGEIVRRYRERGYHFVAVTPRLGTRDESSGRAEVVYHIDQGQPVRVRSVRFEGNRTTRPEVIEREILLQPGDLLVESYRRESQRRLYTTGIFNTANITVGEVSADSTEAILLAMVNERPRRYISIGTGFTSDERQQVGLGLRTSADWGHRNLWGSGRSLSLTGAAEFRLFDGSSGRWIDPLRREMSLRYSEPWFLGRRMPFTTQMSLQPQFYQQYEVNEFVALMGLSYEFSRRERVWANLTYRLVDTRLPIETPNTRDALRGLMGQYDRDTRSHMFSPISGSHSRVSYQAYGGPLGGPSYMTMDASWARYQLSGQHTVLAGRVRMGMAIPMGQTLEVPIFDRFFAGGSNSVRGYPERSLGPIDTTAAGAFARQGGRALLLIGVEYRRPRSLGPFGMVFFLDAGNVWKSPENIRGGLATSAGFELTLDTPLGPVRAGYGWRLNRLAEERTHPAYSVGPGRHHFGIHHAF